MRTNWLALGGGRLVSAASEHFTSENLWPLPPTFASSITERRDNEIDKIYRQLIKHAGSDLHMQVGKPPILRVRGTLRELQMEPITKERMWELFDPMISERDRQDLPGYGGLRLFLRGR